MEAPLGLAHFWSQADLVGRVVAWILFTMSVLSWAVMLGKLRRSLMLNERAVVAIEAFWAAPDASAGIAQLEARDGSGVLARLASAAIEPPAQGTNAGAGGMAEQLSARLRAALRQASRRLDSGLTLLASVGATAPFVGLFGTVWGIYNALIGIADAGQLTIGKVAGPVGEALIMTAGGLAVALPAVLAFNAYHRMHRNVMSELDGFARDLHAWALARSLPAKH
jgi:biopolymer transport protein ExbB